MRFECERYNSLWKAIRTFKRQIFEGKFDPILRGILQRRLKEKQKSFRYLSFFFCLGSFLLASPVVRGEALPGADDLLGPQSSLGGGSVLLVFILGFDGVDPTLWGDVHLDLEKAAARRRGWIDHSSFFFFHWKCWPANLSTFFFHKRHQLHTVSCATGGHECLYYTAPLWLKHAHQK